MKYNEISPRLALQGEEGLVDVHSLCEAVACSLGGWLSLQIQIGSGRFAIGCFSEENLESCLLGAHPCRPCFGQEI